MINVYNKPETHLNGKKLCRDFILNPLKFWNWHFYFTDLICKLPYCLYSDLTS